MGRSGISLFVMLGLLIGIAGSAGAVDAFSDPKLIKQSYRHLEWSVGLGLGLCYMSTSTPIFSYSPEDSTIIALIWEDPMRERELATGGAFTFGYGVSKNLILGAEGRYWLNTFSGEYGDERWQSFMALGTARYHPFSLGLFLKGGVGFGSSGNTFSDQVSLDYASDWYPGLGLEAATGWEWRLPTRDSVMTLLAELSYQHIYREDGPRVDSISLLINLLMYTNNRKLDKYYRGG